MIFSIDLIQHEMFDTIYTHQFASQKKGSNMNERVAKKEGFSQKKDAGRGREGGGQLRRKLCMVFI